MNRRRDEGLAAKTGVNAHDEDVVKVIQDVAQSLNGSSRIKDDTGFSAFVPYESQSSLKVSGRFQVHADHVRPCVNKRFDKLVRVLDHEVSVKGQFGAAADLRHNRGPEGDVGDEMPIHDVEVDNIRPAPVNPGDLLAQTAEVGGEKGGGYLNTVRIESHESSHSVRSTQHAARRKK